MRQTHIHEGDQELVLALLSSILLLPFLSGLIPGVLAFLTILAQLQILGRMEWRKLGRRMLAPLGFLVLSSLVLVLSHQEKVFDLFCRSFLASLLLVLLSTTLRAHQWFELASHWKVDGLILTLSLLALRWIELSAVLWKSMDKGWSMRAQLGGITPSMKTFGWRMTRLHRLHEQRVLAMDCGWQARGLHPVLQFQVHNVPPFVWTRYLLYLLPAFTSYAMGFFMARGLT